MQKGNVADTVFSLAEAKQFLQVVALLESKTRQIAEEISAETCLAAALRQLMKHGTVNKDQLIYTVQHGSYPHVESFLKQYIT